MSARVELYKALGKKADRMDWYWRFVKNGNVMADAGGYSRRIDCLTGCAIVLGGYHHLSEDLKDWNGNDGFLWIGRFAKPPHSGGTDEPFVWDPIPVRDLTRRATAAGRAS